MIPILSLSCSCREEYYIDAPDAASGPYVVRCPVVPLLQCVVRRIGEATKQRSAFFARVLSAIRELNVYSARKPGFNFRQLMSRFQSQRITIPTRISMCVNTTTSCQLGLPQLIHRSCASTIRTYAPTTSLLLREFTRTL